MKLIKILETAPDRQTVLTSEVALDIIRNEGVIQRSRTGGGIYFVGSINGNLSVKCPDDLSYGFSEYETIELMMEANPDSDFVVSTSGKRIVLEKEPDKWVLWKDVQDDSFVLAMHKDGDAADVNPKYEYQQPSFNDWGYYLIKS